MQRLKKDSIPTKMLNLEKRKVTNKMEEIENDIVHKNKKMKVP